MGESIFFISPFLLDTIFVVLDTNVVRITNGNATLLDVDPKTPYWAGYYDGLQLSPIGPKVIGR